MNPFEIVVLVVLCVGLAAAISYLIYRKVKHKGSFDCDCCSSRKTSDTKDGEFHCTGCCSSCHASHAKDKQE